MLIHWFYARGFLVLFLRSATAVLEVLVKQSLREGGLKEID